VLQDSLYSVDALLKNHERFEKLMEQQVEHIEDVKQFTAKLEPQHHYAWDEIKERCQAVEDRHARLQSSCKARRTKLGDSHNYQIFLRNLYEVSNTLDYTYKLVVFKSLSSFKRHGTTLAITNKSEG